MGGHGGTKIAESIVRALLQHFKQTVAIVLSVDMRSYREEVASLASPAWDLLFKICASMFRHAVLVF